MARQNSQEGSLTDLRHTKGREHFPNKLKCMKTAAGKPGHTMLCGPPGKTVAQIRRFIEAKPLDLVI